MIVKNILSTAGLLLVSGITMTSSVMGFSRVAKTFGTEPVEAVQVPEVRLENKQITTNESNRTNADTTVQTTQRTGGQPTPVPSPKPSSSPVPAVAQTNMTTKTSVDQTTGSTAGRCIVTLFGEQYDVTSLQTSHPGGNIFNCGTDMTASYQAQHGTNLSRMAPYKITASGSGGATNNAGETSGTIGASQRRQEDDRDDDKHEEKFENEQEDHDEERKDEEERASENEQGDVGN